MRWLPIMLLACAGVLGLYLSGKARGFDISGLRPWKESYRQHCPCGRNCPCQRQSRRGDDEDDWEQPRERSRQSERNTTRIEGEISEQTLDEFEPAKVVFLDSPGGSVNVAVEIGEMVQRHHMTTVVPDGGRCASACAMIWVAGEHKVIEGNGKVGFHAPHDERTGDRTHRGESIEARYFHGIEGISDPDGFTRWALAPDPDEIASLTPQIARRFGIKMETDLPEEASTPRSNPKYASITLEDINRRLESIEQSLSERSLWKSATDKMARKSWR